MRYVAVIEFPDGHAKVNTIDAEDIAHAALVLRSMCRGYPVVLAAFLCPKQICTPIILPNGEQP